MTIKLTREEAIQDLKAIKSFERYARGRLALDIAIEALKRERTDEWCDDCKEYDTEKKCCPRFNRVIRGALKREPHDDGTLEVKVEDATKVGRVLISDDKHRGGLYYPDEYELQGDLISRADAIEALGEEPPVWCDEEYEIAERDQWRADIEAIKSVPSADRPRGEWTTDEVAQLLANIFGDECACNWSGIDEWLPEACKYAETTCPSPKEINGCWKQFLIQGGARWRKAETRGDTK